MENNLKKYNYKSLLWLTFTLFPDLFGINYTLFGRWKLGLVKNILIWLILLCIAGFVVGIATMTLLLMISVGLIDLTPYIDSLLIPIWIAIGLFSISIVWWIVDIVLVASKSFKDVNGLVIDRDYPGYAKLSRKERKEKRLAKK